ncbi:hypothetical protein [Chryseobacterium rhizosphaerae]|uniref:hypothetical protein n=1 Tax=Chryseobacterium rhizosphaerae TaxID=395937 RepID=UPI001E31591C|nr:hypothetical protein [Chryseobacterium rhizosphaerae]
MKLTGKSRIKNLQASTAFVKRKKARSQFASLCLVFTVNKNKARNSTKNIPINAAISKKLYLSMVF